MIGCNPHSATIRTLDVTTDKQRIKLLITDRFIKRNYTNNWTPTSAVSTAFYGCLQLLCCCPWKQKSKHRNVFGEKLFRKALNDVVKPLKFIRVVLLVLCLLVKFLRELTRDEHLWTYLGESLMRNLKLLHLLTQIWICLTSISLNVILLAYEWDFYSCFLKRQAHSRSLVLEIINFPAINEHPSKLNYLGRSHLPCVNRVIRQDNKTFNMNCQSIVKTEVIKQLFPSSN